MNFLLYQSNFKNNFNSYPLKSQYQSDPMGTRRDQQKRPDYSNRTGHWTEKQNAKYYAFLRKFSSKFSQKESRRQYKVFKALSSFVKTRDANQCRSHHHKMCKDFSGIAETLDFLIRKYPVLEKKCQKYAQQLEILQSTLFTEGHEEKKNQSQLDFNDPFPRVQALGSNAFTKVPGQFKMEMMKTSASYEEPLNISYYPSQKMLFDNCYGSYEQLPANPYFMHDRQNQIFQVQTLGKQQRDEILIQKQEQYKQKLQECNILFFAWLSKMSSLVASELQLLNFQCL